jgi:hypothetical protein
MDSAQALSANFAISVMLGDSIPTQPQDTATLIATIKTENSQLSIYPNPTMDNAIVQVASNCPGNVKLSMYNLQGIEIVSIFNGSLGDGSDNFMCNTGNLASGMYFVTMQSDCETISLKFAKL